MTTHTPGPWKCELMGSEGWMVYAGRTIFRNTMRVLATNLSETDARLIAAAPQLLETLRSLADWPHPSVLADGTVCSRSGYAASLANVRRFARAAIAAAGAQP